MAISIFAPYGLSHPESGLAGLLASYLKTYGHDVQWLRCNGVLSACGRDAEIGFARTMTSCQSCMVELRGLASWSGVTLKDLSRFLTSDDIQKTQRWIEKLPKEELPQAAYHGLPLAELSRASISERVPERLLGASFDGDVKNKSTEHVMRRIILQASRVELAFTRYLKSEKPSHSIIVHNNDFFSTIAVATTGLSKSERILLNFDINTKNVKVKSRLLAMNEANDNGEMTLPILFDDVTKLRTDTRTWPQELTKMMDDLLVNLGLAQDQLALNL